MAATLRRFFRTPKGLLTLILAGLTGLAALGTGFALVAPGLAAAIATAMLLDAPLLRWREGKWIFPDGALLTAVIVAVILSPHEPWYVAALASAIGVISKYALRSHAANIFNPAALALLAVYFVFQPGQSWWGALPEITPHELVPAGLAALIATGLYIADRVNRLPAVVAFLGFYFLLFTITAYAGDPGAVFRLYREADLHAVVFFAVFMVTDPPTSPSRYRDQIVYSGIIAVLSYAVFITTGAVYHLLAGLLAANGWEAWRRARQRTIRHGAPARSAA
jgi:Na+-translocating ferredoxin:NAD+ oxidoreductase RnfD subunit